MQSIAGSRLAVQRWAWHENYKLKIEDLPNHRSGDGPRMTGFSALAEHVGDPPAYWYSEIANVWRASVNAAVLLARWLQEPSEGQDAPDFIARLLAGPADAELLARELALLEAHLAQPVSLAAIQREKQTTGESAINAQRNKLKLIRNFNRNLQNVVEGKTTEAADAGETEIPVPPVNGDSDDGGANRYERLKSLQPAHRNAYLSFLYAEAVRETRLEDRDAWDWLNEHGVQDAGQSKLQDYDLPAFATWSRYLRVARKSLDERKYTPRSGRQRSG